MTIQNNRISAQPKQKDIFDVLKKDILLSMNCHAIATVQSFDSNNMTVRATLNYGKTFFKRDDSTADYSPYIVDYPVLADVPIYVLGDGADCALTFPIKPGAVCSILFNDRDIDNYITSGKVGLAVSTPRLHSFADGVALIGLRPYTDPIPNYDTVRAVLKNGHTMVGVGITQIKISNDNTTLNTLLQSLVSAIKQLTIDVGGVGPGQGVVSSTSLSTLSNIATNISGLLE